MKQEKRNSLFVHKEGNEEGMVVSEVHINEIYSIYDGRFCETDRELEDFNAGITHLQFDLWD